MSDLTKLKPAESAVHCHACSKYIRVPEDAQEGDIVTCPFCHTVNHINLITVWVSHPPTDSA